MRGVRPDRRGDRLHRRHLPGDQDVAVAPARRLAARRDGAAGHEPGLGLAVRARLRDAGRRQGAGRRRRCGTGSSCGQRPSWTAPPRTACWPACSPRCLCRDDRDRPRGAPRAARGARRRRSSAPAAPLVVVDLVIVAAIAVDVVLAGRVRKPAVSQVRRRQGASRPVGHGDADRRQPGQAAAARRGQGRLAAERRRARRPRLSDRVPPGRRTDAHHDPDPDPARRLAAGR